MHTTTVRTKAGHEFKGFLRNFKPEEGKFTLGGTFAEIEFEFDEVESVVTEGERLPGGKTGDLDELQRAREYLVQGRKLKWFDAPVMEWENPSVV